MINCSRLILLSIRRRDPFDLLLCAVKFLGARTFLKARGVVRTALLTPILFFSLLLFPARLLSVFEPQEFHATKNADFPTCLRKYLPALFNRNLDVPCEAALIGTARCLTYSERPTDLFFHLEKCGYVYLHVVRCFRCELGT